MQNLILNNEVAMGIIRAIQKKANSEAIIEIDGVKVGIIRKICDNEYLVDTNGFVGEIDGSVGTNAKDAWAFAMPIIQRGNLKYASGYLQVGRFCTEE